MMQELNSFERYIQQHGLSARFSDSFHTVAEIAQFVMDKENDDDGFFHWRFYARWLDDGDRSAALHDFSLVMESQTVSDLLNANGNAFDLFIRVTDYMREFLIVPPDIDNL